MTYIKKNKESTYVFPEATGGNNYSLVFSGVGNSYTQWSNVDLSGFTTIYVLVDSSGQNWGEIMIPYANGGQGTNAPPSNITRMIIKRKNGGNTRVIRVWGGGGYQINGSTKSTYLTGFVLGTDGETIVFERNEEDISNNNWRVYALS